MVGISEDCIKTTVLHSISDTHLESFNATSHFTFQEGQCNSLLGKLVVLYFVLSNRIRIWSCSWLYGYAHCNHHHSIGCLCQSQSAERYPDLHVQDYEIRQIIQLSYITFTLTFHLLGNKRKMLLKKNAAYEVHAFTSKRLSRYIMQTQPPNTPHGTSQPEVLHISSERNPVYEEVQ